MRLALLVLIRAEQRLPDLRLPGAGKTDDEYRVTNEQQLFELYNL